MVMSVRRAPPLPLIFLLMIHEVSSADWGVNYRDSHICALKDSSVIMSCNYTYPTRYKIKKVFWTKNSVKVGKKYPDLSEDPEYSQRLQYLGDKQKTCTIRLSHVTQKDSHKYYFSLITYKSGFWKKSVKWIGDPGVSLTVTDLQVESPENVTEGQNVSLTCKSSCALTDRATFIWYRNSKPLTERRDRNNQLLLQSVRREDAGRYSCGVEEHTYISPAVQLSVTYPPKSVSLSISPSGVIVEGDSVTLICSSDSNPPAEINWFKEGSFLRSGRIYSISKISSNHSGEYKCKSSNKHGWKYSAVTLNVMRVSSADWSVSYGHSHICALKNSSVIMSCNYTYPTGYQIRKVFWTKNPVKVGEEYPDLSENPEYSQRLQYLGDKQQNCTIRLSHVTPKDSQKYYFSLIADKPGLSNWIKQWITTVKDNVKWIHAPGASLTVTDLQVESPENVTEGQNVSLTCVSSCALTDRAKFIWYRNSKPLTERRDRNNQLLLQSVRREDAGRYSCGVQGHTYISPAVQLNVTYPPNSVSVSISSSGEIVEGDSVTLSCSSDSNPPAEITWFKEGRFLGSGRIYSISNISSNHSGEYKCKSSNKHGWKYSAVTLNVMYPPKDVAMSNFSLSGEIVEGDSVTLICSSDSNPPADINWFKGRMFVGSGRNYSISKSSSNHSGEYKCKASNKHGEKYSDAVILNVMYPPKSVSVSISSSGEIVEGDSVTLSCSSDSNPPAEINWFKEGRFLGSGRIYSISNISSNHSGEYKCKSSNKHGWKYSAVTLNVMYPPKDVAVSNFSLSGEIVEGDSVTLICSSDSNPPADINWFKGRMFVGSGRNYSISKSSSNHSGEYKCKASNKHGEKYSDAVILNVMYPPKSVSVSISSSGEIVEGDSVTLSCSSDSNPPAEINWFKEGRFLGSGRIYRISNISSNHSGEYKCKSSNKHGWKYSAVTLNVMYPPKDVAVSNFSLSGEIVEGGSVTLICSSDSNPPALNFSWFKEGTFVGSGRNFRISNISSNHSGEYKCKSKNKHGEKDSDTVMLNVTYAPRNVMVSISPSGEIVEGDSVTLICSSDSNPPALNFSWFKEGTFVGSGRIYSISNISSDHSGEYKCKSKNKHGEKDSDTVMLNVTYAPRNVSVSISPPGEIVEGDSVTLSCSSDSNPPALNFSWFKEGTFVRSGRNYSISNISSNHSGEYKCKSSNKHGEKDSDTVMLNVTYAPRNAVVSIISPSGEIVEGDSVTLICSSDSNPPALNFSWFKEGTLVWSGRIYSISNISSNQSREYSCKSRNKHGEKDSDTVMLNVTYAPRNVSVSISPPGEIVEGDSVTLTCSSDSNPPALNFTWFKEGTFVGSGRNYSISNISSNHSGEYKCKSKNKHGEKDSDTVMLNVTYAPRNVMMSISPPGEIVEGDSVTLTAAVTQTLLL
ncbi:hemicentin-1-like isoform X2 [Carassius auratus]|uniref:Hemicentin-1-like isoform X2 n=1 Tax=Carassius auratus TaxID=7957 RepID=A0A6P6NFU5_CARAU|nr:hemicentin-1-like isoform X2 [Carassius auratus]